MLKISVVMPAYNSENYISEAIDSILNQTFADFEFIIIDDGSSDRTAEIIKHYSDSRIRFVQNERNLGVAATLNRCLKMVQGEYIARMDADDISLPTRFEKQVRYMDTHSDIAVLASAIELFGAQTGSRVFSQSYPELKTDLLFSCCFAHPTVMLRSRLMRGSFSYDSTFDCMEDYDLWDRISQQHPIAALPDVLLKYRIHSAQVTQHYSQQYKEQLQSLKARQLSRLGITDLKNMRGFLDFCLGTVPQDAVAITELYSELSQIAIANRNCGEYDPKILDSSIRAIMKNALAALPAGQAANQAKLCGSNRVAYLSKRTARHVIAKLGKANQQRKLRSRLQRKDFSILSNNCWGSFVYQKYGLEYRSPTAGLWILGHDFVKLCADWQSYSQKKLEFIPWEEASYYEKIKDQKPYPVAKLGDIEIYFMHYPTEEEAAEKWYRRAKRINPEHMLFKLSQREGCSREDIEAFMALPLEHKICFAYDDVPGTIHVPELKNYEGDEYSILQPYYDEVAELNRL